MAVRILGHYCPDGVIEVFGLEVAAVAAALGAAELAASWLSAGAISRLGWLEMAGSGLALPVALYLADLYEPSVALRDRLDGSRLLRSLGAALLVVALCAWLAGELHLPAAGAFVRPTLLIAALGLAAGGIVAVRTAAPWIAGRPERVVMIGTGLRAAAVAAAVEREPGAHAEIVGFVGAGGPGVSPKLCRPALGKALDWLESSHADTLVVASDDRRGLPLGDLLDCRARGFRVEEALPFAERALRRLPLGLVRPADLLFSEGWRDAGARRVIKRAFDLAAAAVLLVLAAPAMLVTAILVRLSSPGPIFYRQERLGLGGKPFVLTKFRTMRADAEASSGPVWAQERDPRVTAIGAFLRKTRLDELPQLFNVLSGSMSLVGPRPERAYFANRLRERVPFFDLRLAVKPGITGWAQLLYPYGASEEDARAKLELDLYYVKNGSLFLDLVIAFHTAKHVLFGRGAR